MSVILFALEVIVVMGILLGLWVLAAFFCGAKGALQFYSAIPINCFALVTKTTTRGEPVRIVHNMKDMKLIKASGYPLGKFVPTNPTDPQYEVGEDLQKLGWVEKMLGVRFIGIPGFRKIYSRKTAWVKVEMSDGKKDAFKPKEEEVRFFTVTHLFGFILPELELGNSAGPANAGGGPKQRTPVTLYTSAQVTIEDPYLFLIKVDGMTGTQNRIKESVKGVVGNMSQDDLIGDPAENGQIVSAIEGRVGRIRKEFGALLDKITYCDYELAGSEDTRKRMEAANTKLVEDTQTARGDEEKRKAAQADMREQATIVQTLIASLKGTHGLTTEQAVALADKLLDTQGLTKTSLGTYVKGASASVNVGGSNKP